MNQREVVNNLLEKERYDFTDLLSIMKLLRAEGGCPWDREQTHGSIRACMIEEAYEVVEAIDTEDAALLREELGDVLFQVVFHAQIEAEKGSFEAGDVVHDICVKMIHRHPHVFSNVRADNATEALSNWESIKTEEKKRTTLSSRLRAIPVVLPALMRATKVSSKIGFSEETTQDGLLHDLQNSFLSLSEKQENQAEAVGDLLYAIAAYSAFCGYDAEYLLGQAVQRRIEQAENAENAKKS